MLARGQLREAKAALASVEPASSRKAEYWYYRGRVALAMSEGDDAIRHFERAVSQNDTSATYHFWLGVAVGEVTPYVSALRMPFNARRMRKEWDRAVALDKGHVHARFGLIQFHSMAPGVMGGSRDAARRHAEEIARLDPMRGALGRALIAITAKDSAKAEAEYRAAIAAAPDSSAGYFELATFLVAKGQGAEAVATIDRFAQRRPDDRFALYYLGRIAGSASTDLDRGAAALTSFLQAPPPDATYTQLGGAHYWSGRIAEQKGDKAAARSQYRLALGFNPRSQAKRALEALK
jgi:tetratricopeptide (TPR) repeat protein